MHADFRIVTGPCLIVIGGVFVAMAVRLWYVHPVNRVFRLGRFVTEDGLRAVLALRPTLFALGCYFVAAGFSRVAFWGWRAGLWDRSYPYALGTAEALFAIWVMVLVVREAWRVWR